MTSLEKHVSLRLSVGQDSCDIQGFTNTHIQCAVDRVAILGGGEVELSEGVFHMADALHLRSNVRVKGQGATTILTKNAMKQARVATCLGYGHYDVIVDNPEVFTPGDGIIIGDDNAVGFYLTVGTLARRDGNTWFTTQPHAHDYNRNANGFVKTLFPVISAVDVVAAVIEDVTVDGNLAKNETMNTCRGGGFFAHRAHRVVARRVTVRDFNGEGFSFQTCDDLEMDGCVAERCSGNGFHPGSGSNRFYIHHCTARACNKCGLYYCLRVRNSVLEHCVFEVNHAHGVSIGERDTDNLNRHLVIRNNGGAGVYLRPGDRDIAAHRNCISNCTFETNCADAGEAEIVLQGEGEGIRVLNNVIRRRPGKPGIVVLPGMQPFENQNNTITPDGLDAIIDPH